MQTLLINPPAFESDFSKESGRLQPLGLASLAAFLRKHRKPVAIFDADLENASTGEILQKIKNDKPDLVGLTTFTPYFSTIVKIAKNIKNLPVPPKIVIGGPHISALPQDLKNYPYFDFAVLGEGEETLLELIQKLETGQTDFEKISGLAFIKKGNLTINPARPVIKNLDLLPFPARDLLPHPKFYHPSPGMYRRLPLATMLTSRGCPYQCLFCSRVVFGNLYRARSAKNVVDEMATILKDYKVEEIKILDDTFTLDEERVLAICRQIIKRRRKFVWTISARADHITQKMLQALRKAGCQEISFGIESGSQKVLDIVQKNLTLSQIEKAVKLTRQSGLESKGFFMIGLPQENEESMKQTISFAKKLNLSAANFFITIPFPGTKLAQQASKFGRITKRKDYRFHTTTHPPFVPYGLTAKQIKKYQRKAYFEFYLRPAFLFKRILALRSLTQIQSSLKGLLSFTGLKS